MSNSYEWLSEIAQRMKAEIDQEETPKPEFLIVRAFLSKFGISRQRRTGVSLIRNQLATVGLYTEPDFEFAYIDEVIELKPLPSLISHHTSGETIDTPDRTNSLDPTHRISSLVAANRPPTSVKPDQSLASATTIMQIHDFSQVPVMTSARDVKGVISWQSIGTRLSLQQKCEYVRECMEPAQVISSDASLFQAVSAIAEHGYALVQQSDRVITGIVTASDLADQFIVLAGPFLLIGEIEGHLRRLIDGKIKVEQIQNAIKEEGSRAISGVADLTIGEYCRLLQKPEHWEKLNLNIDRKEFVERLDTVRKIRNDVMHFHPDGLSPEDMKQLQDFAAFFERLVRIGAM